MVAMLLQCFCRLTVTNNRAGMYHYDGQINEDSNNIVSVSASMSLGGQGEVKALTGDCSSAPQ
jgi:hypothetical protein